MFRFDVCLSFFREGVILGFGVFGEKKDNFSIFRSAWNTTVAIFAVVL